MEIAAYLGFSGILWLLGLALVARLRQRPGIYAALGCLFPPIALLLYLFVPVWAGIIGTAAVRSSPVSWHTYFDRGGVLGAALVLLFVVGAIWPVIAAWIASRPTARSAPSTP
jgi:hypothetical protein